MRGPTGGGTRLRVYAAPEEALADVLELSAAMTRKFAVCDVPRGGGKAVLAVPSLPEGEASVRFALDRDLRGVRVLVQGMGSVGALLAQQLAEAGADLYVSDVDAARLTLGTPVAPEDALTFECDVLAPCAVGGVISEATVDGLRARIVAGAANNQLAAPELADRLHERGILYAPDYVINAGGVLHGAGIESLGWTPQQVDARLRGIGDQLLELYADDGGSPSRAADRLVQRRLRA